MRRPNPNLLFEGDEVFVPDVESKSVLRSTEARHKFKRAAKPTLLRIQLRDEEDEPLAKRNYRLLVQGKVHEGRTDEQGVIEQQIPADAETGELTVWRDGDLSIPGFMWTLRIGYLDPIDEVSGVQSRLRNLGFYHGEVDGALGPLTEDALRWFQSEVGLEETGKIDAATREKLVAMHDVVGSGSRPNE